MVETAVHVSEQLSEKGMNVTIVNARFVKPIDTEMLDELAKNHSLIVTMEENVLCGGFGEKVNDYLRLNHAKVETMNIAIPDEYVEHGNVDLLKKEIGIDTESIVERICNR